MCVCMYVGGIFRLVTLYSLTYSLCTPYICLLCLVNGGEEFVKLHLGDTTTTTTTSDGSRSSSSSIPTCSGPSGAVPSRLHTSCAHAMLSALNNPDAHHNMAVATTTTIATTPSSSSTSPSLKFSLVNEFNGLRGVFPVDIGVYYGDTLTAFVDDLDGFLAEDVLERGLHGLDVVAVMSTDAVGRERLSAGNRDVEHLLVLASRLNRDHDVGQATVALAGRA